MARAGSSAGDTIPTECRVLEVRVAELRWPAVSAADPRPPKAGSALSWNGQEERNGVRRHRTSAHTGRRTRDSGSGPRSDDRGIVPRK